MNEETAIQKFDFDGLQVRMINTETDPWLISNGVEWLCGHQLEVLKFNGFDIVIDNCDPISFSFDSIVAMLDLKKEDIADYLWKPNDNEVWNYDNKVKMLYMEGLADLLDSVCSDVNAHKIHEFEQWLDNKVFPYNRKTVYAHIPTDMKFNMIVDLLISTGSDLGINYKQMIRDNNSAQCNIIERNPLITTIFKMLTQDKHTTAMKKEKVYLIHAKKNNAVKIGTSTNVQKRLKHLQISCPFKLDLLYVVDGGYRLEARLHSEFDEYRIRGEWFKYNKKIIDRFAELSKFFS
jgi:prophage antirepressor-like protein